MEVTTAKEHWTDRTSAASSRQEESGELVAHASPRFGLGKALGERGMTSWEGGDDQGESAMAGSSDQRS